MRYTPSGTSVCSFGLATNRSWTPSDGGDKVEKAEFHNIVAWGKLAEICGQLLHKGDKAYVDGRIQTRDWKTEDGQERRITEVVIDNMMLLNSRGGGNNYSNDGDYGDQGGGSSSNYNDTSDQDAGDAEDIADDIPF